MFVSGEASHAHGTCDSVGSYLDGATMAVFVRDNSRGGPCLHAVTGRKSASAIEEFAALVAGQRAGALRDYLQRASDDQTIHQRFCG